MNDIQTYEPSKDFEEVIKRHKLTAQQIQALPYVAFGLEEEKIINLTGISSQSLRSWMKGNSVFLAAVTDYKLILKKYHEYKLNQAGVIAWDTVFDLLEEDVENSETFRDKRELQRLKADMAKFVIKELRIRPEERSVDVKVTNDVYVTENSADIIARRLAEIQSETEHTVVTSDYRILDKTDDRDGSPPLVDGRMPLIDGMKYSVLETDEHGKIRCHVCGKYAGDIVAHVSDEHKMDIYGYRIGYGLENTVFSTTKERI